MSDRLADIKRKRFNDHPATADCAALGCFVDDDEVDWLIVQVVNLRFALTQARSALEVAQESNDINASSAARHALQATERAAAVPTGNEQ